MSGAWILCALVAFTSTLTLYQTQAKTVVMFPGPGRSYFIYHSNIGKSLVDLGHEVWLCVPHYLADKGLVKYKELKTLIYGQQLDDWEKNLQAKSNLMNNFWNYRSEDVFTLIKEFKSFVDGVLSDEKFLNSVKDLKPDLFILDGFMFIRNMLVLPYKLDLKFAIVGMEHNMILTRVPYSTAVEPFPPFQWSNRMTFLQRVKSTLHSVFSLAHDIFSDTDIVTRFAPEKPFATPGDILLKAEIHIVEQDYILDYPRPTLPNTKLIGGSSVSVAKPITGEFQKFVDSLKQGFIVISFGAHDLELADHFLAKMEATFKLLDLGVIWKISWNSTNPGKVMTSKWIPQNDLLGHPKAKLFISHCGKNGQYEALYHAVPILCLPIFGDQYYNTERITVKGFGLGADMRKVTSEELADVIKEVANNPKYKTNIQKASELFKELYKVPMKEAAYWFDHVMKYGGDYMRSSGQEMPLYQFLLLDVIAFFIAILCGVVLLICLVIRFIVKCFCKVNTSKSKKSKSKRE